MPVIKVALVVFLALILLAGCTKPFDVEHEGTVVAIVLDYSTFGGVRSSRILFQDGTAYNILGAEVRLKEGRRYKLVLAHDTQYGEQDNAFHLKSAEILD